VLSTSRRVITVDLQAHGRTADIDRPMAFESMADDIAALAKHSESTMPTSWDIRSALVSLCTRPFVMPTWPEDWCSSRLLSSVTVGILRSLRNGTSGRGRSRSDEADSDVSDVLPNRAEARGLARCCSAKSATCSGRITTGLTT